MTDGLTIEGSVLPIQGDIGADEILAPQHATASDPSTLASLCFAGRPDLGMVSGRYPVVICSGLFGIGLVRPQVPAAMAGAGIRIVLAPAFSPLFVENALNGGLLLPLVADLRDLPDLGVPARITFGDRTARLEIGASATVWAHRLPAWALAGRGWIDVLRDRAAASGGLAALQRQRR